MSDDRRQRKAEEKIFEKKIAADKIKRDEEMKQLDEEHYSKRQKRESEKQEEQLKVKRTKEEEIFREKQHAQKMDVLRQKREKEIKELQVEKEKIEVQMQKLSDDGKKKSAQHAIRMAVIKRDGELKNALIVPSGDTGSAKSYDAGKKNQ